MLYREKFPLDKNVLRTRDSQLPIHKVCVSVSLKFEEGNCAFPLKSLAFQTNKYTTAEFVEVLFHQTLKSELKATIVYFFVITQAYLWN